MVTYIIGNIHAPDMKNDPTFDTLLAAIAAAEDRASTLNDVDVWGVWERDGSGWPDLVALAYFGNVYWLNRIGGQEGSRDS